MSESTSPLDAVDRDLIATLRRTPRAGITELARTVGVARNTVQSRLRRLQDRGVIIGFGPDIDPRAAGYDVLAFTTLAIAQGSHEHIVALLRSVSQVVEIHTVTGAGDLLLKIVARSNDDLHDVLQRVTALPEITRTETQLALHSSLTRTVADLVCDERVSP